MNDEKEFAVFGQERGASPELRREIGERFAKAHDRWAAKAQVKYQRLLSKKYGDKIP